MPTRLTPPDLQLYREILHGLGRAAAPQTDTFGTLWFRFSSNVMCLVSDYKFGLGILVSITKVLATLFLYLLRDKHLPFWA
jgi:hypothetical protein